MNSCERDALITIYNENNGYIKDLHEKIVSSIINEFISIGFISIGYTRFNKTWHITKLAQVYIKELDLIN